MIAEGCIMARVCHVNRCPVGVATQKEELRKKFPGTPEHLENFFLFVAEEVRVILAALGYRSLEEICGRSDLLSRRRMGIARKSVPAPPAANPQASADVKLQEVTKTSGVVLDSMLEGASVTPEQRAWVGVALKAPAHSNGTVFDDLVVNDPEFRTFVQKNNGVFDQEHTITNTDRAVGGRISGAIAREHGDYGFEGTLNLQFKGSAGQSFGVFNIKGLHLRMEGEVNDYMGKGMNGGSITILPPAGSAFVGEQSEMAIAGNTCLYGATGGRVFVSGRVGERFGVRNAGAIAVIEGSGDHLGEYMTNGVIVALGSTGRNIGAGMSGGLIYLYDPTDQIKSYDLVNQDNRDDTDRIVSAHGEQQLKELIEDHANRTGSPAAKKILGDWESHLPHFYQVVPPSERNSRFVKPAEPLVPNVDFNFKREPVLM